MDSPSPTKDQQEDSSNRRHSTSSTAEELLPTDILLGSPFASSDASALINTYPHPSSLSHIGNGRADVEDRPPGGRYCLVVLLLVTLLSYLDRYLPAAMKQHLKAGLNLTDTETSYPFTGFLLVYMVFSPIFATLADWGLDRRKIIVSGVLIWSLATASAALCRDLWTFVASRAFVGVGEAALVTVAPTLISDFFPPSERNMVFAVYSLSTPMGAGLGYMAGGFLSDHVGWRFAFLICGLPGVLFSLLLLLVKDPPTGFFDKHTHRYPPTWKETVAYLSRSNRYITMNLAYILSVFAIGGLSDWYPTFLERKYHVTSSTSGLVAGGLTLLTTPCGVFTGSWLATRLKGTLREANFAISGFGALCAAAVSLPTIYAAEDFFTCCVLTFFIQFFLVFNAALWNSEVAISVPPLMRSRAFGFAVFCSHAFGDAISPAIIGGISDASDLQDALLLVPIMVGLSGLIWTVTSRLLPAGTGDGGGDVVEVIQEISPINTK